MQKKTPKPNAFGVRHNIDEVVDEEYDEGDAEVETLIASLNEEAPGGDEDVDAILTSLEDVAV